MDTWLDSCGMLSTQPGSWETLSDVRSSLLSPAPCSRVLGQRGAHLCVHAWGLPLPTPGPSCVSALGLRSAPWAGPGLRGSAGHSRDRVWRGSAPSPTSIWITHRLPTRPPGPSCLTLSSPLGDPLTPLRGTDSNPCAPPPNTAGPDGPSPKPPRQPLRLRPH